MKRPAGKRWINAERKLKRLALTGARHRRVKRQAAKALRLKNDLIRRIDLWLESRDLKADPNTLLSDSPDRE